ncbi:MAG: hypothetical protein FWD36_07180 [Treponema sp.]|nr:hypothetical protein [Treponema sp.]
MKKFFVIAGLLLLASSVSAQQGTAKQAGLPRQALFTWDLLWAGSWEESKTLHNRGDIRIGFTQPGLMMRGQVLDRRQLHFELDPPLGGAPWGDPDKAISSVAAGLYHRPTGSRLLYGVLDEWGLPARIRSPWIRSAPYTENHKPIMADLRTTVSTTKADEIYLYLSSPRLTFFQDSAAPEITVRGFSFAQMTPHNDGSIGSYTEGDVRPAFAGGLETILGKTELLLEGFYTSVTLPARNSNAWFSNPPPLPDRDFRLGAAAMMLNTPYVSLSSDWAWSETFAWGTGVYGNGAIRLSPPLSGNTKPGPWSLSLAADGMSERYTGRDGTSPGGGLRAAGKIERKGPRSSLFRVNTSVRGPSLDEPFNRSASGIYYRFPARSAGAHSGAHSGVGDFPLRISRIALNADRNASNWAKINDGIDANLGLSLNLPPLSLPPALLTASARKVKNIKPKSYPLGLNLSSSFDWLGSADETPSPYPFFQSHNVFDSAKASCELVWSPGIFQFRTRWGYTAYEKKDDQWNGSISAAVRLKHGRFSAKIAWPDFPEKWNCTLSWRLEK